MPAPRILAPMEFRKLAVSTICGSRAALNMVVRPGAITAASMVFMVAPTLGMRRYTLLPPKASVFSARITPPAVSTLEPSEVSPLTVRSMGRLPILQPPGVGTTALPRRFISVGTR